MQPLMPPPSLLSRVSPAERAVLREHARPAIFAPGSFLFGTDACECLFIESGLASLHVRVEGHLSGSVGLVGRTGLLGVPSLLGPEAPHHVAVAVTRVTGLCISAPDLNACVRRLPHLRRAVFHHAGQRFAQAFVCSACHLEHGLGARLADWILLACTLLGREAIPVTHEKLAMILGAARPSITLALQSLEECKAICCRRGTLLVRDRAVLSSLACGCTSGGAGCGGNNELSATLQKRNAS